jgi:hypothetical protein
MSAEVQAVCAAGLAEGPLPAVPSPEDADPDEAEAQAESPTASPATTAMAFPARALPARVELWVPRDTDAAAVAVARRVRDASKVMVDMCVLLRWMDRSDVVTIAADGRESRSG